VNLRNRSPEGAPSPWPLACRSGFAWTGIGAREPNPSHQETEPRPFSPRPLLLFLPPQAPIRSSNPLDATVLTPLPCSSGPWPRVLNFQSWGHGLPADRQEALANLRQTTNPLELRNQVHDLLDRLDRLPRANLHSTRDVHRTQFHRRPSVPATQPSGTSSFDLTPWDLFHPIQGGRVGGCGPALRCWGYGASAQPFESTDNLKEDLRLRRFVVCGRTGTRGRIEKRQGEDEANANATTSR